MDTRITEFGLQDIDMLWKQQRYHDIIAVIEPQLQKISDSDSLHILANNLRLCYFMTAAFEKIIDNIDREAMASGSVPVHLQREYNNCLRYLGLYERYRVGCETLSDPDLRNLDLSWYLHLQGQSQQAFQMTELGRPDFGWCTQTMLPGIHRWRGEPVDNLLLLEEGGDGDMILFARFIPEIKPLCRDVWYVGNSSIAEVLIRDFGVKYLHHWGQLQGTTQAIAVMSLAAATGLSGRTPKPYLTPDPNWSMVYRGLLPRTYPRIGVCWSGNQTHLENVHRSVPQDLLISSLEGLGEILNLQYQQRAPAPVITVPFDSWCQTLSLIDGCDVVVSVDTAVAHAAAALGKPTVVLTNKACYYTWDPTQTVSKSEWYAQAWSVTQTQAGVWQDVLQQVRQRVKTILSGIPDNVT